MLWPANWVLKYRRSLKHRLTTPWRNCSVFHLPALFLRRANHHKTAPTKPTIKRTPTNPAVLPIAIAGARKTISSAAAICTTTPSPFTMITDRPVLVSVTTRVIFEIALRPTRSDPIAQAGVAGAVVEAEAAVRVVKVGQAVTATRIVRVPRTTIVVTTRTNRKGRVSSTKTTPPIVPRPPGNLRRRQMAETCPAATIEQNDAAAAAGEAAGATVHHTLGRRPVVKSRTNPRPTTTFHFSN